MELRCSYCQKKCSWYCNCNVTKRLCTYHTKFHKSPMCKLFQLKPSKYGGRIKAFLKLEIQSRISKVSECILQIETTTKNLLESIESKSKALIANLASKKDSLESVLSSIDTQCQFTNWILYLTKIFKRNDKIDEKCLKVVEDYYDQEFFIEETKMCMFLGHAEQAKYILSKDYKLQVEGHFDCVSSVTVTRDDKFVVSAGDETIRVWDLENYSQEGVISNPNSSVFAIAVTRNCKFIISGGSDAIVHVWDLNEKKNKCELSGHTKSVISLAVGKSNEIVVSGGEDGKVKIWNFIQKILMANFDAHSQKVKGLVFSKNSKYIISGGWDENVKIWKFKKKSLFMTINFKPDYVNSICHTCCYQVIVAHSNMISIHNIITKKLERRFKAHELRVNSLFLSRSGNYLVSSGQDKSIKLWDTNKFTVINKLDLKAEVSSISLSNCENSVIIGSEDKTLKRWKIQTNELLTYESHTDSVSCIKATGDNKYIISAGTDNDIRIWSLTSKTLVANLKGHTDWVRALYVTANNKYLLSGGNDKVVKVWNLNSMKCKCELTGSKLTISSILYCHIYNLVVAGTEALALVWKIKNENFCEA